MRSLSAKVFRRNGILVRRLLVSCIAIFCSLSSMAGCGLLREKTSSDGLPPISVKPLAPEKAEELISEVGENWLYGEGLGNTAINIGAVVAFPPYALVLLGNGILDLSGYEPVKFSDALPEEDSKAWQEAYSDIASGPGRFAAAAAGKEYRSEELIREDMKKYFATPAGIIPAAAAQADSGTASPLNRGNSSWQK